MLLGVKCIFSEFWLSWWFIVDVHYGVFWVFGTMYIQNADNTAHINIVENPKSRTNIKSCIYLIIYFISPNPHINFLNKPLHHIIYFLPLTGYCSWYSDWLHAGRLRSRSSNPSRVKNFLFSTSSRPALGPTQPPIQWVPVVFSPGVKRPGREADYSPPTSAEVKKTWIYTSTPLYVFMAQCLIS
jgi:hypothetical protein